MTAAMRPDPTSGEPEFVSRVETRRASYRAYYHRNREQIMARRRKAA